MYIKNERVKNIYFKYVFRLRVDLIIIFMHYHHGYHMGFMYGVLRASLKLQQDSSYYSDSCLVVSSQNYVCCSLVTPNPFLLLYNQSVHPYHTPRPPMLVTPRTSHVLQFSQAHPCCSTVSQSLKPWILTHRDCQTDIHKYTCTNRQALRLHVDSE